MPTFFQRPDNALKRANEFIDVGKKHRALDTLYDVIKSKRHRTWQKIHEPIMQKYLELCIELKKSHVAKEGLYQYKNICQQVNIASLDDIVRSYLALAEVKTEEARLSSHQAVLNIDDLDSIQTSEDLLLSAVSVEGNQDRNDRAILTPWVKFLWESYRQCLDLLRNNNSVEKLYQDVAQMAFKFCLKYERKTEFRKLCENLRAHLQQVYKHSNQPRSINLEKPESQSMHLETRLVQLDHAIQLELWQEAFKAVEDVHGLIHLSKKAPKPSLMSNYYQKLALVCWKSGNHLYHASSLHRLFTLSLEQRKNLTTDEIQKLASRVLCATLAIPISQTYTNVEQLLQLDEVHLRKQRRLSALVSLQVPPTRCTLIKDMIRLNIIQQSFPAVRQLYHTLELDYHPLKLSDRVKSQLEFLKSRPELCDYIPSIQDISVTRLIKQISQAYETITFERLNKLAPFVSELSLERNIVQITRSLKLQIRIDHRTKTMTFGSDLSKQSEQIAEGPILQPMPSDTIRAQLTSMANVLDKAVALVNPVDKKRGAIQQHIRSCFMSTKDKDHARVLNRKCLIDVRKEKLESATQAKQREEMQKAEYERRKQVDDEISRLEREANERELQRRRDENLAIQRKAAREKLDQLKSTAFGARAFEGIDEKEIAEMNIDDILAKQVNQLEKEKKELAEKLRTQEKKIDYFERAKHLEEIPLRKAQVKSISDNNKIFWDEQQVIKISKLKQERKYNLTCKERLSRMEDEREIFLNIVQDKRQNEYLEKKKAFDEKMSIIRAERLEERRIIRVERRKQDYIIEQEEKAKRKEAEKKRKLEEERLRKEREAKEREKEEHELKMKKMDEMERKKREREREIESKMQKTEVKPHYRKTYESNNTRDNMNFKRKDFSSSNQGRDDASYNNRESGNNEDRGYNRNFVSNSNTNRPYNRGTEDRNFGERSTFSNRDIREERRGGNKDDFFKKKDPETTWRKK